MLNILVLDDAVVIRSLLRLTLTSDDHVVDEAQTVDTAIEFAQSKSYDLILCDFMLDDGETGLDFIKAARTESLNKNTPIVMLSAEDSNAHRDILKTYQVSAWIKKPFTPIGLLRVIYKVLNIDYKESKHALFTEVSKA
ncbi:response regulator [Thiosulfativibrio zosterae]|uniref:Response regulatory domain-containing protein n=1 Tax=Thiosulfativibrio zosterae TaxID=2675053 RepID=A0A6F8PLD6_9GAMM|nr:response regulator [Thiosulfativibrio zosterae]BBP42912.1 hypothetical protein THMIRHAT_06580 [Thiosulfativibrio zosterae]